MRALAALVVALCGCTPAAPPPPVAPPPPAPVECAPGRVAKGDHCVAMDTDCRAGETLEFGLGCVPAGASRSSAGEPTLFPPGVAVRDVTIGTGPVARSGATIFVHYTGTFVDGTPFDSSVGKQPFKFKLGGGMVIKGWDEGLVGMRVGGRRVLTLEPEMAYGERGRPPQIPPRATLVFTIDLLEVK